MTINDSRIQVAIENAQAAIEAMEKARADINELSAELPRRSASLTYASVDLGHSIRRVEVAINYLNNSKGAKV